MEACVTLSEPTELGYRMKLQSTVNLQD